MSRPAPASPAMRAAEWVEAERIRRREVLVQGDGPVVCAQRRRDMEADVRRLQARRQDGRR